MKSKNGSGMQQSKHASEIGLRPRAGKWAYRFKFKGEPFSGTTDLLAVPENVLAAQAIKQAHIDELRKGKKPPRHISVSLDQAVVKFIVHYRAEHQNRKCKWAVSLMASFQYYFTSMRCLLPRIGAVELEDFKQWRRENSIGDCTLRKQLILIAQFFKYARKHGWTKGNPFDKDNDDCVTIPAEPESDVMRIFKPAEESAYLTAAKQESQDLYDICVIMKEQGPRPDEVMSLKQAHVDLFRRQFTIWDTSAKGKSKNAHRTLRMTDETFRIFARRLLKPGVWVFPSMKNSGPRRTIQKSHEAVEETIKLKCRPYDFRHTFATRFALAGGSLPLLQKLLGHADLGLLNRYIHPAQTDMNNAMDWYNSLGKAPDLQTMLAEDDGGVDGPRFCPPYGEKGGQKHVKTANAEITRKKA
jgi:integrase